MDCCPDEGEFVETQFMPLSEAKQTLLSGGFNDAKTIVALQAYFLREEK